MRDLATFEQPNQLSQGMDYVLVNDVSVIAQGKLTGALPGKVLRELVGSLENSHSRSP